MDGFTAVPRRTPSHPRRARTKPSATLEPALLPGEPESLDAVAGPELADGLGQVVAHGAGRQVEQRRDVARRQAARGKLPRVAPRRFNPARVAWLPVLRIQRGGHNYLAHFTNTARSHQLGQVYDWVAVFCEDKEAFGQWTVVTATHGPLAGRRVVRGRERECQAHYGLLKPVQKCLPNMEAG